MKLNIATGVIAVVAVILVFLRYAWGEPWTPWRIVGLAIAAPAFLLFVVSRIQLGRAFSVQAKATTLVKTGIYARIRNPIYVFGGLVIAGAILWTGHLWWLLIFVLMIPVQVLRVRKEEQVLKAKFGDEYTEYKRKTWF